VELPQGLLGWGDILEAWYVELDQVSPDWGDALEAWCVKQAPDILGHGGALEVSSVELAQPVLAGWLSSPGKCGALAQDALGCADALETVKGIFINDD
jgi:hypothetical protein